MSTITLKVPDDLHYKIKQMQLDLAQKGEKITLTELYIQMLREHVDKVKESK